MDPAGCYKAFLTPAEALEPLQRRRLLPLVWQAGAVDSLAIHLLRCYFLTQKRPHYRKLPDGFAAAAGIYAAPELAANPGVFFRKPAGPHNVRVKRVDVLPAGERLHITFASTYQTYFRAYQGEYSAFSGNGTVHGRLWRHAGAPRPTVLCIHGWGGGHAWLEELVFAAAPLYAAGLNVVLMVLPFHGARRPRGHFDLNLFPGSDFRRTNEAFGQSVADARALMQWLRATGVATKIGVMGMSLGGYITALLASVCPDIDFALPIITPVSLGDLLWNLQVDTAGRAAAEAAGFGVEKFRAVMAVHCPLHHALAIPRQRVVLVGGHADRVVPPQHVLALWEHWQRPRLRWFPGGHYMHFGRHGYLRDLLELAGLPLPADGHPLWRRLAAHPPSLRSGDPAFPP